MPAGIGRSVIKFWSINVVGLVQDPVRFSNQMVEFVRLNSESKVARACVKGAHFVLSAMRSPGYETAEAGELSRAIKQLKKARFLRPLTFSFERYLRGKLLQLQSVECFEGAVERSGSAAAPRVLFHFTNALPYTQSGYTLRSKALFKSLRARGVEAFACTRYGYPENIGRFHHGPYFVNDGLEYFVLGSLFAPFSITRQEDLAVRQLVRLAKEKQVNILHTTTPYTNARVVARAAALLEIPWIYEVRGEPESTWASQSSDPEKRRNSEFFELARQAETAAMMAANQVIALSEVSKEDLTRRGVPESKIKVVPNALEADQLKTHTDKARARKRLGLGDEFLIGAITSVVDYEGLDIAITAMKEIPDATLIIVGDGVARPGLEDLVDELDLNDQVVFAGRQPVSDIHFWYAALDVFVVPRRDVEVCRKVTPLKPLQAMARGVPVVGSDLPALREITGGLMVEVEPDNPSALARSVDLVRQGELIVDPRELEEWAKNRSWERNAHILEALYVELLSGR